MYYEKLARFFKKKELNHKKVGELLGFSPAMIGRYLNGSANISPDFIIVLTKVFPELDLNELFATEPDNNNIVEEPTESYNFNVIKEIEDVEKKLNRIKAELAKKS